MDAALRIRIGFGAFVVLPGLDPAGQLDDPACGHGLHCRGPCLVPVAPGLLAPSGVLTVGAALVLRDVVQRCLGLTWGLAAIAVGTALSALVAPGALVLASGAGVRAERACRFRRLYAVAATRLTLAVVARPIVGLLVDSVVFLGLAFGSLDFLAGQVVGKLWAVLIAIPLMRLLRRVAPTPA